LMLVPWEKTKTWARRWSEVVVALLLAKPLAATVLAVAIKLFADSKSFAGLAAGTVGMALACGAPLMALRLVSFAGGELAAAAQTAGGGHVLSRTSSIAARQVSRQIGGRFTLAGMLSRSSMTRPIRSSRPEFPTRSLPATVPAPSSLGSPGGGRRMLGAGRSDSARGTPGLHGATNVGGGHHDYPQPTPPAASKPEGIDTSTDRAHVRSAPPAPDTSSSSATRPMKAPPIMRPQPPTDPRSGGDPHVR
jgi:hypothetical protein